MPRSQTSSSSSIIIIIIMKKKLTKEKRLPAATSGRACAHTRAWGSTAGSLSRSIFRRHPSDARRLCSVKRAWAVGSFCPGSGRRRAGSADFNEQTYERSYPVSFIRSSNGRLVTYATCNLAMGWGAHSPSVPRDAPSLPPHPNPRPRPLYIEVGGFLCGGQVKSRAVTHNWASLAQPRKERLHRKAEIYTKQNLRWCQGLASDS